MTACQPKLYKKRQMLAKVQSACDVFEPLNSSDGKLRVSVGQDATPEVNMNERDVASAYLSKLPNVPGAVMGKFKFSSELAGSGSLIDPPETDVYLRGCGLRKINLSYIPIKVVPVASDIDRNSVIVGDVSGATGRVAVPVDGGSTKVFIELISGNFTADETVSVQGGASAVFTALSQEVAGGFSYAPRSSNRELITLRSEEDGLIKCAKNCAGTFSLGAEASGLGKIDFDFSGVVDKKAYTSPTSSFSGVITAGTFMYSGSNIIKLLRDYDGSDAGLNNVLFLVVSGTATASSVWLDQAGTSGFTIDNDPVKAYFGDDPMTTGISFYSSVPPVLQDSDTKWGSFVPTFSSIAFDVANEVKVRANANDHTGLATANITDRKPSGSVDPEVVSSSDFDFYNSWFDGALYPLQFRFGYDEGNTVYMFLKSVQAQNSSDQDKDGDASVSYEYIATGSVDDEFELVFV